MKQLKKILVFLLTISMILGLFAAINFTSTAETEGLFDYTVNNEQAKITKCNTSATGDIEIPSTLGGYPVTSIANYAFSSRKNITAVTIPDGVTTIGTYAFWNCTNLTTIVIPDSVISVGNCAFSDTPWYTNKPDGLVYIGKVAFTVKGDCPANVTVEEGTHTIAEFAFEGRAELTDISIPDSVSTIGDFAFASCTGLTDIQLPGSVITIGAAAFSGCTGLTSITIPTTVTSIGDSAFSKCTELSEITVEAGNPVYHSQENCLIETQSKTLVTGCKNSVIPDDGTVTTLGESAFAECAGLTGIDIPEGVTSLGIAAFSGCTQLGSVSLPQTLTLIGRSAFYDCAGLTDIVYGANLEDWDQIEVQEFNESLAGATIHFADGTLKPVYYPITYHVGAGTNHSKNPIEYTYYDPDIVLQDPTCSGYAFKGWYLESAYTSKVTQIPTGSRGEVDLYAKWEKAYTITYKLNSGTNHKSNPKIYTNTTAAITLKAPTRKGYAFKGWYSDSKFKNKVTKIPKGSSGNKTFYAKWAKNTYKITYKLNKGKNSAKNPKTYTVTTKTITLKNPTRKGYTFKGWYSDAKFTKKVTKITKGSTGNKTLYAKWKKK